MINIFLVVQKNSSNPISSFFEWKKHSKNKSWNFLPNVRSEAIDSDRTDETWAFESDRTLDKMTIGSDFAPFTHENIFWKIVYLVWKHFLKKYKTGNWNYFWITRMMWLNHSFGCPHPYLFPYSWPFIHYLNQRTLSYFVRGSIVVWLTSSLTGLDLAKQVNVVVN